MTSDDALANAVRLLEWAEAATDCQLAELWGHWADTWVGIAQTLSDREAAV